MKNFFLIGFISTIIIFLSCGKFEFSPNEVRIKPEYRDLNAKAIYKILNGGNKQSYKIGFIGDTQRFYADVSEFTEVINQIQDIDFVIVSGDLSDFGLLREYEWMHERLSRMSFPYLAVIGNHDILANGDEVFREMYGPLDFSFIHDSVKYIFVNTNGLEYGFNGNVPDMNWLDAELQTGDEVRDILVICHVAPYDRDFDPALSNQFANAMARSEKLLLVMHGHNHNFQINTPFNDGVTYLNSSSPKKDCFVVLSLDREGFSFQKIDL
ncbi:MAG: metallophosphoesterase [Bacteroidetes bacterium]|nr:MAG: metallophosphoesterase [Bacteroidota bacterium]REK05231.1 MAG: metallophosphoesterase [Bacteroidota bacterium]REK32636.1 MAG: metallophosphoesterase [Bacteroidota bacterium]REK48917.1 MAG: metallophosphoesterase [Bacteroidota bacterium]